MTPAFGAVYAACALGAAALWLALPDDRRPAARRRGALLVLAAAALAWLGVHLAGRIAAPGDGRAYFVCLAIIAVLAAARVVTHTRPVYNAVYLLLAVLAVAGLCILAAGEFLAAALVIVYGGAILVTYVFVIMLAQQPVPAPWDLRSREPLAAAVMGFALAAAAGAIIPPAAAGSDPAPAARECPAGARAAETGNTLAVGRLLMARHVVAVEVAGVLLLVAMAGALTVARKRIEPADLTEAERHVSMEDPRRRGREAAPF